MKKLVNFPSKVKIGGHLYEVVYPYTFKEESDAVAQCNYHQCKIRVQDTEGERKRDASKLVSSFLHELLHIIDHIYNHDKINDLEDGEDIIIRLTSGWFQVLTDNDLFLDKPGKMPKAIKIGGFKYKVIYPFDFEEGEDASALIIHGPLEFFIGSSYKESDSSIKCKLIGLILRIIDIQYRINKGDEDILQNMVEGIYQVFKDNNIPKIVGGR